MWLYKKILYKLNDILSSILAINCKLDDLELPYYGIVTSEPVDAPVGDDPVVVLDTTSGVLWYWDGDSWEPSSGGDTHMGNTDLVFTGSRTYTGNGGIVYNDVSHWQLNTIGATGIKLLNDDGVGTGSSVELTPTRVDILATDSGSTVGILSLSSLGAIWGDAAGIYYIGDGFFTLPPTADNAQGTLLAIDPATGRLYRRTVASIGSVSDVVYGVGWNGDTTVAPSKNAVYDKIQTIVSDTVYGAGWNGDTTTAPSKNAVYDKIESLAGGTNFATTDLTLTGDRVHTGSNTRSLTIQNLTAFAVNTGSGNQSITLDNIGNGILVNSDASISLFVDYGGGVNGSIDMSGGFLSVGANTATDLSGINIFPGILGLQFRDNQGNYNFDATGGSALPSLDDVGETFEGASDRMLTVDANGRILRKALPASADNFATADLTFTGSRSHDLSGNDLELINGQNFKVNVTSNIEIKVNDGGGNTSEFNSGIGYCYISGTNGVLNSSIVVDGTGNGITFTASNGKYSISSLPEYADDTAAGVGGLTVGFMYRTATGQIMVKL